MTDGHLASWLILKRYCPCPISKTPCSGSFPLSSYTSPDGISDHRKKARKIRSLQHLPGTRGVKKPLNPILGELFTGYWEYPDGSKGYYISEQTSHHPPKSSYFFMVPEHSIRIDGTLKPRSKFLGNSAASLMEGIAVLRLMNRGKTPGGER